MLELTIIDKLKILIDLVLKSPFFIFMFVFTFLMFIILLDSKNYKRKKIKKFIFSIYILVFIAIIIKYHTSFISVFDYLMNNVFVVFYFPNIAIYGLMILITNIVMLRHLFSNNGKIIRTINIASYSIIMYLMLLVIFIITKENIDVYNQVSLYSNEKILSLIELSNIIFVFWMILNLINKIVNFFINKKSVIINQDGVLVKYIEKEVIKEVPVEKIIYKEKPEEHNKEEYTFTKEEYLTLLNILKSKED